MKTGTAAVQVRDFDLEGLEVKAAGDDGYTLSGYGSVFGVEDSYGDVVAPGAFNESLAAMAKKGRKLPMLWQHRTAEPIGVWNVLKEDKRGLYMEGSLLKGVQVSEEARIRAQAGAVTGLSIGYYTRASSKDEKTGIITLTKLDLVETSLVTFPANDDARVDAVKFMLAEGSLPTLKDFERFLRCEAGLSKTAARLVVTRGYAELCRRESEGNNDETASDEANEIKSALAAFRSTLADSPLSNLTKG